MKYTQIIIAVMSIFLIQACGVTSTSTEYKNASVKTRSINQGGIIQIPMLVDLKVEDRKITGTYSGKNVSSDYAKNMAIADALAQSNADVLIEPQFVIVVKDMQVSADVSGHPAYYKNFRKPTTAIDTNHVTNIRSVKYNPDIRK